MPLTVSTARTIEYGGVLYDNTAGACIQCIDTAQRLGFEPDPARDAQPRRFATAPGWGL